MNLEDIVLIVVFVLEKQIGNIALIVEINYNPLGVLNYILYIYNK